VLVPLMASLLLLGTTALSKLTIPIAGSLCFISSGSQLGPPSHLRKSLARRPARGSDDVQADDITYASFESGLLKEVSTTLPSDDEDMDDLQGYERFTDDTEAPTTEVPATQAPATQVAMEEEDAPPKAYIGVIKSFAQTQGYGFIKCQATFELYKADVFLHKNDARKLAQVSPGTPVRFAVQLNSNGRPQAREVSLYSSGDAPSKTVTAGPAVTHDKDQVFVGRVKKYDATAGFGFLDCAETLRIFGRDVFLHKNQATKAGNPRAGQFVKFCVEVSSKGQPQSRNVTMFEPLSPQPPRPGATGESVPADELV